MRRPNETVEQWRERMAERAAAQRYFTRLERGATEALYDPPSRSVITAQVKPRPAPTTTEYRDCSRCHKPMRLTNQKVVDHPGTVVIGARGLCHECSYHPERQRRPERALRCTKCDKVMRTSGQRAAEFPGTVTYGKKDTCQGCVRKAARAAAKK